ncbi:MAG TPA: TrmH family RNA methyltransferase [Nocardioides sp.]|jgi:TrmH family RNA methyltransferase|nr:TrmH family RNA methyltransferase [Nocardioides sp.]
MPSPPPVFLPSAPDVATLHRLRPVGPSHDVVRRYSRARRNLLPRADHVTAVSGVWAHQAVLRSEATLEVVLWCPGERPHPELEATAVSAAARASRAFRISERILTRIQPDATAPALLSLVELPGWEPDRVLGGHARLVLVADGIEYAGNLGTLVRTADACAADALVLTRATARVTHPKAFAASRGTVLTTPVLTYDSIASARAALSEAGFTAYVADPAGATPYRSAGLGSGRTAVVVGSEGDGVSDEWRVGLTRVAIPMLGRADSLNVAASAAVLLFEARAALDQQ